MAAFLLYTGGFIDITICKICRKLFKNPEILIRVVKEYPWENIFLCLQLGEKRKNGLDLLSFTLGSKTLNIVNHVMLLLSQKELLLGKK